MRNPFRKRKKENTLNAFWKGTADTAFGIRYERVNQEEHLSDCGPCIDCGAVFQLSKMVYAGHGIESIVLGYKDFKYRCGSCHKTHLELQAKKRKEEEFEEAKRRERKLRRKVELRELAREAVDAEEAESKEAK